MKITYVIYVDRLNSYFSKIEMGFRNYGPLNEAQAFNTNYSAKKRALELGIKYFEIKSIVE